MKRLTLLALSMLSAALISAPAALAQVNWTLGDVDSASHWGPKAGQQLSETVDKATGGKLKITVYPTESLFKGKDSLDAVSKNLAQIYRVAGFHVAGEAQPLELMDLPLFVPWDYDFRVKVWDAVTPLYRDYLKTKYGIYLAGILQAEPRMIYTKTAFKSLADLKGRKIRSAGPTETEFTRAFGMTPVAVAPSEIYTGLQQGLLDGNWVADAPHFFNKGYEVTKFIYDVGSAGAGFFVMVNEKALEGLPAGLAQGADGCAAGLRRRTAQGHAGRRHQRPAVADQGRHDRRPRLRRGSRDHAEGRGRDRRQVAEAAPPEGRPIYEKVKAMVDEYNAKKK